MFEPTTKDYWRGIILYGKNSATYKMALGNLLIDYGVQGRTKITLDELAEDFYEIYQKRVKNGKRQNKTIGSDSIMEQEIWKLEKGATTKDKALTAIKKGPLLGQVLRFFPNLFGRSVPVQFYTISDDERYLNLREPLLDLFGSDKNIHFKNQINSRWDLLEFAFEYSRKSETLGVDERKEFVIRRERRTNLTPLKPTLTGYQDDRCFYCGEMIFEPAHVDHVIPYKAIGHNEIWNLVVAHEECNESKLDSIPGLHFIENMITRNEFVIKSSLPLHEELERGLGPTAEIRRTKIMNAYSEAKNFIPRMWGGYEKYDPRNDLYYRGWIRHLGGL